MLHRCYSPGNRKGEICEKKNELSYLARLYISYCEELIVSGVKNWVKVVKSMVWTKKQQHIYSKTGLPEYTVKNSDISFFL